MDAEEQENLVNNIVVAFLSSIPFACYRLLATKKRLCFDAAFVLFENTENHFVFIKSKRVNKKKGGMFSNKI